MKISQLFKATMLTLSCLFCTMPITILARGRCGCGGGFGRGSGRIFRGGGSGRRSKPFDSKSPIDNIELGLGSSFIGNGSLSWFLRFKRWLLGLFKKGSFKCSDPWQAHEMTRAEKIGGAIIVSLFAYWLCPTVLSAIICSIITMVMLYFGCDITRE